MRGSRTSWKSPSSRSRPSSASKAWSPTPRRTAPPSRRSICARKTTRRSPPSSSGSRCARPKKRPAPPRRPHARPPRPRAGRGRGRRPPRRTRRGREAQAPATPPRRALPPPYRACRAARGHVRPRRGGLRPVARPRRPGRPDLRRALGGPPPRRDHDRGRPDRDPPRRRRRGRRERLTAGPPRSRGGIRSDALVCESAEPWEHGTVLRTPSAPGLLGRELRPRRGRRLGDLDGPTLVRAADALLAASRHRKLEVEDEAAGARLRPVLRGRGLDRRPQRDDAPRGPGAGPRRRRGGRAGRHAPAARRVVPGLRRRSGRPGGARRHAGADRGAARHARVRRPRTTAARSASRCSPRPRARTRVEIDQLYVTPEARGHGHRRPARRGRAGGRRARRRVGRGRRRGPGASALRAARLRDRVALPRASPGTHLASYAPPRSLGLKRSAQQTPFFQLGWPSRGSCGGGR